MKLWLVIVMLKFLCICCTSKPVQMVHKRFLITPHLFKCHYIHNFVRAFSFEVDCCVDNFYPNSWIQINVTTCCVQLSQLFNSLLWYSILLGIIMWWIPWAFRNSSNSLEVSLPPLSFLNTFNFLLVWALANILNPMNLEKHSPFLHKN